MQKAGPLIHNDSSSDTPPVVPEITLDGITLRPQPLSRGPLAVLYRGWDRVHRCEVVVKLQRLTDDPVAANRFGREAAVMLRLRHPSIVALYASHEGNPAALVMEYVPGPTLAALVSAEGRLSPARAAQIIEEIAAALDCIHALGIVHRDVKPSNILLPRRGPAKLTDFGVARIDDDVPLTVMGDILGTIEYASPEQVHGNGAVDARSDVYSLAAVAYFALTGTPPFRAADSTTQAQLSVMHRQVFADPPPLRFHRKELSPAIEEAVLRGLAKAPDARYNSAGQFAAMLRAAVAAASGEPQQEAVAAASRRAGVLAGGLAGAAALLLVGLALWKTNEFKPSPSTSSASTFYAPTSSASTTRLAQNPAPLVLPKPSLPKPAPPKLMPPKSLPLKHIAARPHPVPRRVSAVLPAPKPAPKMASVKPHRKPILTAQVFKPQALKPKPHRAAARAHSPGHLALIPKAAPLKAVPSKREPPSKAAIIPISPKLAAAIAPNAGAALPPAAVSTPVNPSAGVGWYTVSGWIAVADQAAAPNAPLVRAPALWIKVDGQPYPALALGQWAALPAGKHLVTFQPAAGLGAGPKTWAIDLAPLAHLNQQVPLPPAPLPAIPPHLRNP